MAVQGGGTPFLLQYDNPQAKKMRSGAPASTGDNLERTPPPFDPRQLQAAFIKNSTNPLKDGFNAQDFDSTEVQKLINKAGTNSNFGEIGNTFDPKDPNNIDAQKFLKMYQEGVQRQLVENPVNPHNLDQISQTAPYQKGDGLMNTSKPFPGGDPGKIE